MNKIKEIDEICKKYNIKNYVINKNGSIDLNRGLDLHKKNLEFLPLKFNVINGNCIFSSNKLKSLIGSPVYVNGNFDCSYNKLTSLKYSPKEINGGFNCSYNKLKTLEYGPEKVNGNYYCYYNRLIILKDVPKIIHGNFSCSYNKLKTLEYGPESVYDSYFCTLNKLKDLKGCAKYIKGVLYIDNNRDLYKLEGLMYCKPKDIECRNTIFYNVWRLFEDVSKIELFNDMDIIRENNEGKPVIILDRLNDFLDIIGKPRVKHVEGYINI